MFFQKQELESKPGDSCSTGKGQIFLAPFLVINAQLRSDSIGNSSFRGLPRSLPHLSYQIESFVPVFS